MFGLGLLAMIIGVSKMTVNSKVRDKEFAFEADLEFQNSKGSSKNEIKKTLKNIMKKSNSKVTLMDS